MEATRSNDGTSMQDQSPEAEITKPRLHAPRCDDGPLWDLWLSRLHLPALVIADELGLFEFLSAHPASPDVIADRFDISRRGAEALLGVLAGLEFLRSVSGRFHLTNISREYLLPSSPYYWGGVLSAYRAAPNRHTPENMLQAFRNNENPQQRPISHAWQDGSLSPEQAQQITAYMHAHSFPSAMGLAGRVPINGISKLLDVGAGSGCFSIALALRHEHLCCSLLDLPAVCKVAAAFVQEYGLSARIAMVPANFFKEEWPREHDAILFSNVLHDWDTTQCKFLLRQAFDALDGGGQVLIHEMLQGDDGADLAASTFSLQMAVGTQGSQFTAEQLTKLLTSAGFSAVRFFHTFAYFWTVIARKP